jgi:hypothetical protein
MALEFEDCLYEQGQLERLSLNIAGLAVEGAIEIPFAASPSAMSSSLLHDHRQMTTTTGETAIMRYG